MKMVRHIRNTLSNKFIAATSLVQALQTRVPLIRGLLAVIAIIGLSGCSDMSQFAGAVGGAASEFTCALLKVAFTCET